MKTSKILFAMMLFHAFTAQAKMPAEGNTACMGLTADEQHLVMKNNGFGFRLFSQARTNDNMVLSPLSVTYALSLLNNGAAGQTRQEISSVLGFGEATTDAVNSLCGKLLTASPLLDPLTQVVVANAVYVNHPWNLTDTFSETAQSCYDATVEERDFSDGQTVGAINQWASDRTNRMIPRVVSDETFDLTAAACLLNAIYLKGTWTQKFDPSETKAEPFGETGVTVPMMHLHDYMYYTENDTYQALQLPYGNKAYRMTVLLPREVKTLNDVLSSIDGEQWGSIPSFTATDVDVKLPRIDTSTDVQLNDVMQSLGMSSTFNETAEFPDFCSTPVYIGQMRQSARLTLDEEGTEASAVTIGIMPPSWEPSQPCLFHANRPFLYVISEGSTGAIFFIGQFTGTGESARETTSVNRKLQDPAQSHKSAPVVYDLQGRRLTKQPQRGVYIQDGRKVVVK